MWILRSFPVLVVERRVFARVSAERLTVNGGFARVIDVLPPESCELALAHPGPEREG
jgi:hypothetical protein